jgi:membrane protease YdiL (CAAX protease family)
MASGNTAIFEPERFVATDHKRRDLFELSIGYALILVVIWTPRPWQRLSYAVAATFLVAVLWIARPGWKAMGFTTANFLRSLWVVGAALCAAAIVVLVARRLGTLLWPGGPVPFIHRYLGYALGAFIQQILLQNFFLPRLLRLTHGPGAAIVATAVLFSLAHLPNPILTVITLVWGIAACALFLRYRNLYTLAIAHTILGAAIAMTVPGPMIHNMRVGLGYVTYSSHRMHHRIH